MRWSREYHINWNLTLRCSIWNYGRGNYLFSHLFIFHSLSFVSQSENCTFFSLLALSRRSRWNSRWKVTIANRVKIYRYAISKCWWRDLSKEQEKVVTASSFSGRGKIHESFSCKAAISRLQSITSQGIWTLFSRVHAHDRIVSKVLVVLLFGSIVQKGRFN